jgi:hypothetical protein
MDDPQWWLDTSKIDSRSARGIHPVIQHDHPGLTHCLSGHVRVFSGAVLQSFLPLVQRDQDFTKAWTRELYLGKKGLPEKLFRVSHML